mmetsp:Transcript_36908/g.73014  ORF Transcript_36908/g.73014 Transcript_36908/m.73014 type:complete len:204 (-) Transcript_36908:49-660(-)
MPPAATAAAMFADDQACHSTLWQSTQQGHGVRTPGYHCSRSSLTSTSFVFWATVPHQRVRNADFLVMAAAPSASRCSFSNVSRSVAFSAESMEQQETHIEEEDAKAETATTHADVAKAAAEKATEATDKAVEDAEWASDASDWVLTVNFAAMSLVLGIGFISWRLYQRWYAHKRMLSRCYECAKRCPHIDGDDTSSEEGPAIN